jgi:thiamine transport system permease protein
MDSGMVKNNALLRGMLNFFLDYPIDKHIAMCGSLLLIIFIFVPFIQLIYLVFFSSSALEGNIYFSSLMNNYFLSRLWFTTYQAMISVGASLLIGLPAAYIFYRIDFPFKNILLTFATIPFILPVVVVGLAFKELFGTNGLINYILNFLHFSSINLQGTIWLIILAHVYYNIPIIIRIVGTHLQRIHQDYDDASSLLGAGNFRKLISIYFPLLISPILSSALLVFLFCFTSFGIVLILGNYRFDTIEVVIYRFTTGLFNLQEAMSISIFQIIFCVLVFALYSKMNSFIKSNSITTKTHFTKINELKFIKKMFVVVFILFICIFTFLPVGVLFFQAFTINSSNFITFQNFITLFTDTGNFSYISPINAICWSIVLAIFSSLFAAIISFFSASYIDRKSHKLKSLFGTLYVMPLMIPAITLSIGLIITFNKSFIDLRHSVVLLIIAHTLLAIPFLYYLSILAINSIPKDIKDACLLLGCNRNKVSYKIYLPIARNYILTGIIFSFGISLGEFGSASMLRGSNFYTIPLAIYQFLSHPGSINLGNAFALSVLLVMISFIIFYVIEKFKLSIFS